MRLTDGFASILAVDGFRTLLDDLAVAVVVGLTSAADATAGAGHDLDGVELFLAFAHSFEQGAGVGQTVSDTDVDGCTVEVNPSVTDASDATEFSEVDLRAKSLFSSTTSIKSEVTIF